MFKISVVITTFNRRNLVPRAIGSVLEQSHPLQEIIVIDDGSDDGTDTLIRQQFPQVVYYWQKNQGISCARNQGITMSGGDWIAFLDADDEWLPGKLQQQADALAEKTGYNICHTNEIWIRRGRRVNPMKKHRKYGGYIFEKCLPLCIISPSSVIINRSLFDQIGRFDPELPVCEDYDLWLRVCCREPVLYIDKPLITKYGSHADQLSRKYWGMDRFRVRALEKILKGGSLTSDQSKAVLHTLIGKITIIRNGAVKRGNLDLANEYTQKLANYKELLLSDR